MLEHHIYCQSLLLLSLPFILSSQSPGRPGMADLLVKDCKEQISEQVGVKFGFCIDTDLLKKIPGKICLKDDEIIEISSFTLFEYNSGITKACDEKVNIIPGSNSKYNTTCIQAEKGKEVKQFMLPFMKVYSGKLQKNVADNATDIILEEMDKHSELPAGIVLQYDYSCRAGAERKESPILHVDICQNGTSPGSYDNYREAFIKFSASSYMSSFHLPSCYCEISSGNMNHHGHIIISAVDVRLTNRKTSLKLHSQNRDRTLDTSEVLYWQQDGKLMDSNGPIEANLVNLDPNNLPDSVWLKVEGTNLTFTCGMKALQEEPAKAESSYKLIIFIVVGVFVLLLVVVVAVKCLCRKLRKKNDEYDFQLESVPSSPQTSEPRRASTHEVVYTVPHKPAIPKDEGKKALLESQNYFELEHQYEEAGGPSNNNYKPGASSKPSCEEYGQDKDSQSRNESTEQAEHVPENVYNHLRERPDVVPSENVYDTTGDSEYSQLKRNVSPPPVIDNVYNQCV